MTDPAAASTPPSPSVLAGRTALVTGGTGGIGLQTAIGLARAGATVIITGRDAQHGNAALARIRTEAGSPATFLAGDVSTRTGIERLAATVLADHARLDVLVNNAGVAAAALEHTVDGFELDFAVNAAAPYGVTRALLPALLAAPGARVVNLSGGDGGTLDVGDLDATRGFAGLQTYSHSKRATEAVTLGLARRLEPSGATVNIVYPGQASTSMTRGVTPSMLPGWMRLIYPVFKLMVREDGGRSAVKASRSSVWAATAPELAGITGTYHDKDCRPASLDPTVMDPSNQEAVIARIEQAWGPASWG